MLWFLAGVAVALVWTYWDRLVWYQEHQAEIDSAKAIAEGLGQMGVFQ